MGTKHKTRSAAAGTAADGGSGAADAAAAAGACGAADAGAASAGADATNQFSCPSLRFP